VKYEIYNLINRLAKDGIGIIVISSDLPELSHKRSHRGHVGREGNEHPLAHDATQEKVMTLATGSRLEV